MPLPPHTLREVRALGRLAAPIVLANLCWMLVSVVDIVMLGRSGEGSLEAVTAAAQGGIWIHMTQVAGMGLVMGIDPIVAQGHGARDRRALGRALQRGLIVALLVSIPVIGLRFLTAEILSGTRGLAEWIASTSGTSSVDHAAVAKVAALDGDAERYALMQSFATPFFMVYVALRQYLQGRGILRPALVIAILANVVNVIGNWVLIYELGWGITGAGLATGITRVFMGVGLLWLVFHYRLQRGAWVPWDRASFHIAAVVRVLKYGIPIGLHFALEVGAFGMTTFLASMLGVTAVAAHAVVINLASLTFMVPLGIGLAASTRVGNLIGERRFDDAQESAHIALWLGALAMAVLGLVLYFGRDLLPGLYLHGDADAILMASMVLPIAAAFQIFDGLQVVGSGILRGMGRTIPSAVFNFIAWWVIALPLAAWFVLKRDGHLEHIWWSLVLGLGVVAVLAVWWVRKNGPASMGRGA